MSANDLAKRAYDKEDTIGGWADEFNSPVWFKSYNNM
jgi:hypothetical protein